MSATPVAAPRRPMQYRWLLVLLGLAVVVAVLLVYAQNTVYQPATPFTGGSGDHVHAFALDPSTPGHLYLGSHYGFFNSQDDGAHWSRLNGNGNIPADLVATSVSISPLDGRTVYVTGYLLGNGNAAGLFVTRDDGAHWTSLATGGTQQLPDPRILFVAAGWSQPGEGYAYSIDFGLFRTTDAGGHWQLMAPPFAGQVTAFVPYRDCGGQATTAACPERFLVGTTQGLQRGATTGNALTFAPVAGVEGYVYAVTLTRGAVPVITISAAQGLFRSSGGAAAFAPIVGSSGNGAVYTSLAASPVTPGRLFGVTRENVVQVSDDGGQTWHDAGAGQLTRNVSQLQAGLRAATGNNTPQWAGGQNIFSTLLQTPAAASDRVYVAISFPVQLFQNNGSNWQSLH